MKKHFLWLIAPLLVACSTTPDPITRIATGLPITPIRMTSDTTHVVMTDYVPLLMNQKQETKNDKLDWLVSDQLEILNLVGNGALPEEMDIVNHGNTCEGISVHNDHNGFVIPVLPNKPVKQGLVSMHNPEGAINCITVGFTEPITNERLVVYVQNMPITSTSFTPNEDGTYTLDLSESKEIKQCNKGRAYLRVFAEDNT